jgi:hypothetical protein
VNDLTHFAVVNFSTEGLFLISNELEGKIPSKVWQLTKLSEYTVIDCHDALTQSLWAAARVHLVILMVCSDCLCSILRSFRQ